MPTCTLGLLLELSPKTWACSVRVIRSGCCFIPSQHSAALHCLEGSTKRLCRWHPDLALSSCAAAGAGDITDTYFRNNQALNGASVWQNDCQSVTHSGSRFDDNVATQACAVSCCACMPTAW